MKDVSSWSRDIDLNNIKKNLMSICEATRRKIMGSAQQFSPGNERGCGEALTATNKPGLSMSMYLSSHTTMKSLIMRRVSCKAPFLGFWSKIGVACPEALWQGSLCTWRSCSHHYARA